ncbi:hypothetical protein SAMN02910456_02341 [Ruminococcaceae bacterium YRB3002]|nr:hypothetical protein SAMN02910456_02341 [Ruminococcaceae bacterium YRB3002]
MRRKIINIIVLIIAYLIMAIPFKVMVVIPGFADIRPITALGPIYSLFFGIPGCIVFALLNLVMDIASDSLRWSSIAGLVANFTGPFLIMLYWTRIPRKDLHLRTPVNVLEFSVTLAVAAVLEAAMITPSVVATDSSVNALVFALSVVANTALFPIIIGIPVIILLKEEFGFKIGK